MKVLDSTLLLKKSGLPGDRVAPIPFATRILATYSTACTYSVVGTSSLRIVVKHQRWFRAEASETPRDIRRCPESSLVLDRGHQPLLHDGPRAPLGLFGLDDKKWMIVETTNTIKTTLLSFVCAFHPFFRVLGFFQDRRHRFLCNFFAV